ncbi:MAG: CubicO group peptidase (beta-lactamase class C family) [Candidatus Poriferisodalaceae bacterium]|jgi:CubicO group peptidase (beta-lactamase class C family)
MTEVPKINGHCDERFSAVRDAFEANFAAGAEIGACAAVTIDGEMVVDLWAGDRNAAGEPWERDTIVNVYSTTKTMAGVCMLMLADQGRLDFNAPVAQYWPDFAQNGKKGVLVSHVMSHQAGLSGFEPAIAPTDLYDRVAIAELLASMEPWWEPGTGSGYHAITQGQLQGEILRRIDGRTLGTFFREEVAGPLGADFHIGLHPSEGARVADLDPPEAAMDAIPDMGTVLTRTFRSAPLTALEPRTPEWRAAEIPAAGGTGNARAVARVHSALACGGTVDGVTLMSPEGVQVALQEQCIGTDLVLGIPVRFGMGYGLNHPEAPTTPTDTAFYWGGWGGSTAVIDPGERMSVSYVMNNMANELMGDTRGINITAAAYASI